MALAERSGDQPHEQQHQEKPSTCRSRFARLAMATFWLANGSAITSGYNDAISLPVPAKPSNASLMTRSVTGAFAVVTRATKRIQPIIKGTTNLVCTAYSLSDGLSCPGTPAPGAPSPSASRLAAAAGTLLVTSGCATVYYIASYPGYLAGAALGATQQRPTKPTAAANP